MSTYWGYSCRTHTPPLNSEMWFNHGDEALRRVLGQYRAGNWPTDEWGYPLPMSHNGHLTSEPTAWLSRHEQCDIGIINEYGNVTK